MLPTRYLTTEDLADLTRCSPKAVANQRHRGLGPRGTRVGRRVLYAEADVHEWLEAHKDDQRDAS